MHYGLRSASSGEAAAALNAANLTIVMLETPTAIANAEEIAAVPGMHVLLIGTNDCAPKWASTGISVRNESAKHTDDDRCRVPGMAGVYNETITPR